MRTLKCRSTLRRITASFAANFRPFFSRGIGGADRDRLRDLEPVAPGPPIRAESIALPASMPLPGREKKSRAQPRFHVGTGRLAGFDKRSANVLSCAFPCHAQAAREPRVSRQTRQRILDGTASLTPEMGRPHRDTDRVRLMLGPVLQCANEPDRIQSSLAEVLSRPWTHSPPHRHETDWSA